MKYIPCDESEATHVRVIEKHCDITENKIYKIHRNTEEGFEGEEMILSEDGKTYYAAFSSYMNVEWLKETI